MSDKDAITMQELLDEVWIEFKLDSDWWDNQPDAGYLNELESVKFLAKRIEELEIDPNFIYDVIISSVKFRLPEQAQTLIYSLAALETASPILLERFFDIFIQDGLDYYMSYWIAFNANSPQVSVNQAALYASETEDPELLELVIEHQNIAVDLRKALQALLEEIG